jgi:hypothetical protein
MSTGIALPLVHRFNAAMQTVLARTLPIYVLIVVGLACGSQDASENTPDATTGSEAGDGVSGSKAGAGGVSQAGAAASGAAGRNASAGAGAGANAGAGASTGVGANAGAGAGANAGAGGAAVCDPSCPDGDKCELVQVTCIRAPCPPIAMCVGPKATSCDPAKILCKRAVPVCPEGQVPSVDGSCYGDCVPVETCACTQESECPNHDSYTCHKSAAHCGPYV